MNWAKKFKGYIVNPPKSEPLSDEEYEKLRDELNKFYDMVEENSKLSDAEIDVFVNELILCQKVKKHLQNGKLVRRKKSS